MARQLYQDPESGQQVALDPSNEDHQSLIDEQGLVPVGSAADNAPGPQGPSLMSQMIGPATDDSQSSNGLLAQVVAQQGGVNPQKPQQPPMGQLPNVTGQAQPGAPGAVPEVNPTSALIQSAQKGVSDIDAAVKSQHDLYGKMQDVYNVQGMDLYTAQQLKQGQDALWQKNFNQLDAELTAKRNAVANAKIDPNAFYHNLGTFGMIGAAISMALNTYGNFIAGAPGAPNNAMNILNQAADREFQAQKMNVDKLKDVYGLTQDQMKDQMILHGIKDQEYQQTVARINGEALLRLNSLTAGLEDVGAQQKAAEMRTKLWQNVNDALNKQTENSIRLGELGVKKYEADTARLKEVMTMQPGFGQPGFGMPGGQGMPPGGLGPQGVPQGAPGQAPGMAPTQGAAPQQAQGALSPYSVPNLNNTWINPKDRESVQKEQKDLTAWSQGAAAFKDAVKKGYDVTSGNPIWTKTNPDGSPAPGAQQLNKSWFGTTESTTPMTSWLPSNAKAINEAAKAQAFQQLQTAYKLRGSEINREEFEARWPTSFDSQEVRDAKLKALNDDYLKQRPATTVSDFYTGVPAGKPGVTQPPKQ